MVDMPTDITVKLDPEAIALLGEIRDLLKAQNQTREVDERIRRFAERMAEDSSELSRDEVDRQVQAVNAEPMDNTNLWGTR